MTPKQKAGKIFRKVLYELEWNFEPSICKSVAKELALIAVDEILNEYWLHDTKRRDWWQEVKQEINKL